MSDGWIMVPKESWRSEIKRYLPRLDAVTQLDSKIEGFIKQYESFWPDPSTSSGSWCEPLHQGSLIAFNLMGYAVMNFNIAINIIIAIKEQWNSGLFVIVPLNTRFVFETWGAIHFSKSTLFRLCSEKNIQREQERLDRLIFGAKKSEVILPFGGVAEKQSFSVMEFIRCLKDEYKDAEKIYDFLSEASHPNMFQNFYFLMAGPPISNWDNIGFKNHGRQLLDKTLTALEMASKGLQLDVLDILQIGTSYIEKQCNKCT